MNAHIATDSFAQAFLLLELYDGLFKQVLYANSSVEEQFLPGFS